MRRTSSRPLMKQSSPAVPCSAGAERGSVDAAFALVATMSVAAAVPSIARNSRRLGVTTKPPSGTNQTSRLQSHDRAIRRPRLPPLTSSGTVLALRSQWAALSTVAAAQTRESSGFQVARLPPGLPATAPRTRATDPISDSPMVGRFPAPAPTDSPRVTPEPHALQRDISGGQGRNRTTDTRIFSPLRCLRRRWDRCDPNRPSARSQSAHYRGYRAL